MSKSHPHRGDADQGYQGDPSQGGEPREKVRELDAPKSENELKTSAHDEDRRVAEERANRDDRTERRTETHTGRMTQTNEKDPVEDKSEQRQSLEAQHREHSYLVNELKKLGEPMETRDEPFDTLEEGSAAIKALEARRRELTTAPGSAEGSTNPRPARLQREAVERAEVVSGQPATHMVVHPEVDPDTQDRAGEPHTRPIETRGF